MGHNRSRARSACEAVRGRPAVRPGRNRRDDRRGPASPANQPDGAPDQRPWPARVAAGLGPCGNCAGRGHTPKKEPPRSPKRPSRSMAQSARQPSLVRRLVNRLPAPSAQQAPCRPESRRTLVKIGESDNANPAGRPGRNVPAWHPVCHVPIAGLPYNGQSKPQLRPSPRSVTPRDNAARRSRESGTAARGDAGDGPRRAGAGRRPHRLAPGPAGLRRRRRGGSVPVATRAGARARRAT